MSLENNIRFIFDDAKAGRAITTVSSEVVSGTSDNFLVENFKPFAQATLGTSSSDWTNRLITLFRKECISDDSVADCEAVNVLTSNFTFTKSRLCTKAAQCAGLCVKELTDLNVDRTHTFQIPGVKASNVAGYSRTYDREPSYAAGGPLVNPDWNKVSGVPPTQQAFMYIQARQVDTDLSTDEETKYKKATVVPTALKICFPECGGACKSGFDYVDSETVAVHANGAVGAYSNTGTYPTISLFATPGTFPDNVGTDFKFLHAINSTAAERTANVNSAANAIPHAHLRFEWQAYYPDPTPGATFGVYEWRTLVVQYECTSVEGCVIFPCLSSFLETYSYTDGLAIGGASEFRLAVSRYATAVPTNATADVTAWLDMPCIAFTLAEIEMVGTIVANYDDEFADDDTVPECQGTIQWVAIPPTDKAETTLENPLAAPATAVGKLVVVQGEGATAADIQITNYSTDIHTYRVHVISATTEAASA